MAGPELLFQSDIHANRPAANAGCVLFICQTHNTIDLSNASTWTSIYTIAGSVAEILDIPTAETNSTLVLAPDGAGGVEFRAESGGSGSATDEVNAAARILAAERFR